MKIMIIGANGMLGHALYRYFSKKYEVLGTTRQKAWCRELVSGVEVSDLEGFSRRVKDFKPDVIFNCVGIIKQVKEASDTEAMIRANALWPHSLSKIAQDYGAKVIHFSTDCVFSGKEGMYDENSFCDSRDVYGLSKYLGELNYQHTLTLRTSIIGHELGSSVSLIDWFLSQGEECKGFTKAIYSGFPTISLAEIIDNYVLERLVNNSVSGLYHLSSEPISKYELLSLVAKKYGKQIDIKPFDEVQIDRSLDSTKFRKTFDFQPKPWPELVDEMHQFYKTL